MWNLDPKLLIVGGAAIFSILIIFIIGFIVIYQKRYYAFLREKQKIKDSFQKEILKAQLETQEKTFYQIGEEIHDNVGQLLSSTKMLLGIAERGLKEQSDPLRTAQETLSKAISELRSLSKSLNREWLFQFNLVQNLETEIDRLNLATGIQIELLASTRSLPLESESQVMLFRIVQEALHNCLKHAQATVVKIEIVVTRQIEVLIKDNGKGFLIEQARGKGVGVLNMNHRTVLLGGRIDWKQSSEGGTEVHINLPITH